MQDIIYKLPQEFLHKLKQIYPNLYPQVAQSFINRKATTFRINYAKGDLISLRRNLIQQRIKTRELEFPAGAFILKSPLSFSTDLAPVIILALLNLIWKIDLLILVLYDLV